MKDNWRKVPQTEIRDIRILIDIPLINQPMFIQGKNFKVLSEEAKQTTRSWLVQVYEKITSDSFYHYQLNHLTESQVKAYTGKNILLNIQNFMIETKRTYKYSQQEQARLYIYLQSESVHILKNVLQKYPQSSAQQGARRLKQVILEIDVRQSDQFDLLRHSKIAFEQKEIRNGQNYYSQIMQTLNHAMKIANQKLISDQKQQMTNFEGFQKLMENILSYAGCDSYYNIFKNCILEYKNEINEVKKKQKLIKLFNTDNYNIIELEQYKKDKEKAIIKINQKIPSTMKIFTEEDVKEGIFTIDDVSILRVLTKWGEELQDKIMKSEEHMKEKVQAFKDSQGNLVYLETVQKNSLHLQVEGLKREAMMTLEDLRNHCGEVCSKLAVIKEKIPYKNDIDGNLGVFSERIQGSVSNYMLIYVNHLLNSLVNHPSAVSNGIRANKSVRQQLKSINLVTLKIGDLMRCKCKASEKHIIKIYQLLIFMTNQCPQLLKIIRVKNRLNQKDNDLLINIFFMNKVQCQIQLEVSSRILQPKQEKFNSFNHLIYELDRSKFGPIAESACLIAQYDPFVKNLIKNRHKKVKEISTKQYEKKESVGRIQYATYLPFFCKGQGCKEFKKLTNSAFYKNAYRQNYCNECYEKYSLKQNSQKYIEQVFRLQKNQKIFAKIKKHYQLRDFGQIQDWNRKIMFYQGFVVMKNRSKPNPQYCKFVSKGTKLYILAQNEASNVNTSVSVFKQMKQDEKFGKILFESEMGDEDKLLKQLKEQIIFFVKKNDDSKLVQNKQKAQHYLQCKCCEQKQILLHSEIAEPFEHLKKKNNKKIITETYQKRKTGLVLSLKGVTDELVKNQLDLSTITRLQANGNPNIETGLQYVKSKFERLEILNLSECSIKQIRAWNLNGLKQLIHLKLSHNSIKKIQSIQLLTQLKLLDLGNNEIEKIENLKTLTKINELHLEGNLINVIQNLENLTSLESLFLQYNKIDQIKNLKDLMKLKEINLKGNKIAKNNFHNIENQINFQIKLKVIQINLRQNEGLLRNDNDVIKELRRLKDLNLPIKIII